MKKGILPTAAALLVCAALLGVPALWARLADARRLNTVQTRPTLTGALDEAARAIPVLYELHASASESLTADERPEQPDQDPAVLCTDAAGVVTALADAGVIDAGEQQSLDTLLAQPPATAACRDTGDCCRTELWWYPPQGDANGISLYYTRQNATGALTDLTLPVSGSADLESRLRAWMTLLGLDALDDWKPLDIHFTADSTLALYSAKGQATVYGQLSGNYLTLMLMKDKANF